jgi:hypothetical protein
MAEVPQDVNHRQPMPGALSDLADLGQQRERRMPG